MVIQEEPSGRRFISKLPIDFVVVDLRVLGAQLKLLMTRRIRAG